MQGKSFLGRPGDDFLAGFKQILRQQARIEPIVVPPSLGLKTEGESETVNIGDDSFHPFKSPR
jgi:hypothetical protein